MFSFPKLLTVSILSAGLCAPLSAADPKPKLPFTPSIEKLDPDLDHLIDPKAQVEKLAVGFTWSEGPVWKDGGLLFSDVPENTMYRWKEGQTGAEVFMKPSGMLTPREGFREQGSNGLGVDAQGRLVICQHGERRLARVETDGKQTTIADRFQGKRFNSPNDVALRDNGDLYFTDPPYGLDGLNNSPLKELAFNGVYRVTPSGEVSLVVSDLTFPNGIAFSPDYKTLYVAISDPKGCRIMAYGVQADGSVKDARVFFDGQPLVNSQRPGLFDGLKVDVEGNVFATGPGGVLVISPKGKHLGTIRTGVPTGNCAWGDDGSVLYITADATLCRIHTQTRGADWRK
jgi:gluconolactonase